MNCSCGGDGYCERCATGGEGSGLGDQLVDDTPPGVAP
jgi:hypothetical protein